MQTHTGVAAQMFRVLADNSVNIHIVTTSEIKISVLIDHDLCDRAVNAVHEEFQVAHQNEQTPQVGVPSESPRKRTRKDTSELEADIVSRLSGMEEIVVSDIYSDTDQARVTITQLDDHPGVAAEVFFAVADGGILVDMIIQNVALDGKANISFTVPGGDVARTIEVLRDPLQRHRDAQVSCDESIGKISVVGIGLRSHTDVGARMFHALGDGGINVQMVNTSEIKVSVVVAADQTDTALTALRMSFNLSQDEAT
jgi:aspartate kinase